jgi:integrase
MKFTDRGVRNLQAKEKRFEIWEARGLGLRVAPSGLKTWIFLYRFDGKSRRVCLGRYPRLSVAQAHRAHGVAVAQLADGIDPGTLRVREKKSERDAPTIATLAKDYIDKHARPKKRSWKADDATLRRDVLPVWGDRKAKEIRRRDVIDLLDGIVLRGAPIAANRTFAMVRRMFSWAIERDMLEHSPCTHVRRPAPEHRRDRVLSSAELAKLWPALSEASVDDPVRLSLAFMLATAQRLGEILSARWEDIDLAARVWTIPAEKAKNGLAHRVPLSPLAHRLLARARLSGKASKWVFASAWRPDEDETGENVDAPIERHAPRRWIQRNLEALEIEPFTPHDLRRTAASHMTSVGIPRLTVSKILNHAETGITSVYDRHSYDAEKKKALERWALELQRVGTAAAQETGTA